VPASWQHSSTRFEQRGGRYSLQTMREGGGMANATIIERLS
jgi:acetyl-CoA acyltransferase